MASPPPSVTCLDLTRHAYISHALCSLPLLLLALSSSLAALRPSSCCRRHVVAKDSSGRGNDLSLISSPTRRDADIRSGGNSLRTGQLTFRNNVAVNKAARGMPEKDFTVEFWAKGAKLDGDKPEMQVRVCVVGGCVCVLVVTAGQLFVNCFALRISVWECWQQRVCSAPCN